jgi:hypothetical protein
VGRTGDAIIERGGVNDLFLVAARRIGRKVAMAAGKP